MLTDESNITVKIQENQSKIKIKIQAIVTYNVFIKPYQNSHEIKMIKEYNRLKLTIIGPIWFKGWQNFYYYFFLMFLIYLYTAKRPNIIHNSKVVKNLDFTNNACYFHQILQKRPWEFGAKGEKLRFLLKNRCLFFKSPFYVDCWIPVLKSLNNNLCLYSPVPTLRSRNISSEINKKSSLLKL